MRKICGASLLFLGLSPAALAGGTANLGAVSEYMFRGVEQSAGVAAQGGLDFSTDLGFYAGTWVSNVAFAGYTGPVSYETDLYAGFTRKWGAFGVDVGALYYYYRDDAQLNTVEGYLGLLAGPATLKVFYTPEYFGTTDAAGDDLDGTYAMASVAIPLSETLSLTPQAGYSFGDGPSCFVTALFEPPASGLCADADGYMDYSLTLGKALDNGFAFSFAVVGTDLRDDDEKLVVGLKKTFDL